MVEMKMIMLDRYALKTDDLNQGMEVLVNVGTETQYGEIIDVLDDDEFLVNFNGENVKLRGIHLTGLMETSLDEIFTRVATNVSFFSEDDTIDFYNLMYSWGFFIPGGRILAGAGNPKAPTYYNCFVLPSPHDSREGIIQSLSNMSNIMAQGGGVGINVSSLRPRKSPVRGVNGKSSGAVSWGELFSFTTGLIEQGGSRRGALMLILNDWHPDVLEFIKHKQDPTRTNNANISIGVSDAFMHAVKNGKDWILEFPDTNHPSYDEVWDGDIERWKREGLPTIVHQTIPAKEIWNSIIESAWASAEPGLWFRDRANKESNSWYYSPLVCTNPCAEQPLPAYGCCNLGALNLAKFVTGPIGEAKLQERELRLAVKLAVKFLDNVISISPSPMKEVHAQQTSERRIGLGVMGLGEMLIRMGLRYGSEKSSIAIKKVFQIIRDTAYKTSAELAAEKGPFPAFNKEYFMQSNFVKRLPDDIRDMILTHGIRNVTLLTVAPTGTTGTMMGTSTGIEPYFSFSFTRKSRIGEFQESPKIVSEWYSTQKNKPLPDYFVTAHDLTPMEHLNVLGWVQEYVDSSISKTVNCPEDWSQEQIADLYMSMYDKNCKGGAIYRNNSRREQVLYESLPSNTQPTSPSKRPVKVEGVTFKQETPVGTAFITVNNKEGSPFEVFVNISKAGSSLTAIGEALGRLISIYLQNQGDVEEVVKQLRGIGGSETVGFGENRVASLPDAIGRVLSQVTTSEVLDLTPFMEICPQCGYTTLMRQGGCQECTGCGFSKC